MTNRFFGRAARIAFVVAGAAASLASSQAGAQLQLPANPLPIHDAARPLDPLLTTTANTLDTATRTALRATRARALIRANPQTIEADPNGAPMLRARLLALSPSDAALTRLQAAGFTIVERRTLAGVDIELAVLAPPPRLSTRAALRKLRALDPAGSYDFDHLYAHSGAPTAGSELQANPAAPGSPGAGVGLIDAGVDAGHPALRDVPVRQWGCGGRVIASAHGTAVASLISGVSADFRGSAAGTPLYSADVYCAEAAGGAVESIAAAAGWLAERRVGVINISLVGPPNLLLERVVRTLAARGHLIVAAVGNDGPAAPPLYPAAYPEVVAVTAVDARDRALVEAGRGPHVDFAAPGADMLAATPGGGYETVRGTSFAAPIVAGLLAARLPAPDLAAAGLALQQLGREAVDLGSSGVDRIYGRGLVGAAFRNAAPAR